MDLWQSKHRKFYEFTLVVISLSFLASVISVAGISHPTTVEVAASVGWVMFLTFLWLLVWSFRQHALADEKLINHQLTKVTGCTEEVTSKYKHLPFSDLSAELWSVKFYEIKRRRVYVEYCFVLEKPILLIPATLRAYQNTKVTELLQD